MTVPTPRIVKRKPPRIVRKTQPKIVSETKVEVMEAEPPEDNISYTYPGKGPIEVYISAGVIEAMRHRTRNRKEEMMGFLIGDRRCKWEGREYSLINKIVASERGFEAGKDEDRRVGVKFGPEAFKEIFTILDTMEKRGEHPIRFGWYHSHPTFTCFLSETDLDTHKRMFTEPHQVAMVIDPAKKRKEFAVYKTVNRSVDSRGYKEVKFAIYGEQIRSFGEEIEDIATPGGLKPVTKVFYAKKAKPQAAETAQEVIRPLEKTKPLPVVKKPKATKLDQVNSMLKIINDMMNDIFDKKIDLKAKYDEKAGGKYYDTLMKVAKMGAILGEYMLFYYTLAIIKYFYEDNKKHREELLADIDDSKIGNISLDNTMAIGVAVTDIKNVNLGRALTPYLYEINQKIRKSDLDIEKILSEKDRKFYITCKAAGAAFSVIFDQVVGNPELEEEYKRGLHLWTRQIIGSCIDRLFPD